MFLGDDLERAVIRAPGSNHVERRYLDVGGDERVALFQHPTSTVVIPLPVGFSGGTLRSACGVATRVWPLIRGPVTFRLGVIDEESDVRWLHAEELDPRRHMSDQTWKPIEVALPGCTQVVFETSARNTAHAEAGWADPEVECDVPPPVRRARRASRPNVLLITADACRPSAGRAPLPAARGLAADGLRLEGRLVSTMPSVSLATLLTGRYPFSLGMLWEWSALPASVPNIATELARAGYVTGFAPAQTLYGSSEAGFGRVFSSVLPCTMNPNQPGDVTTRRAVRWLDGARDDRPWFLWVSYFDMHPPYHHPAALTRRFYDGDPRDPAREYRPEALRVNYSIDLLLSLDSMLPALKQGVIASGLVDRLRASARGLDGTLSPAPDLVAHLPHLGPHARLGLPMPEFVRWLDEKVDALDRGIIDSDLVEWLEDRAVPGLLEVQADTVRWLEDLVDYRYVVAQAEAGAAYVDQQIDELMAYLRREGLYEECTVVYAASHVEIEAEQGHLMHHRLMAETNLQVPLVWKPARRCRPAATPVAVDGAFELVDVLPTLLDSLGLDVPFVDGVNRWPDIAASGRIPDHETFCIGYDTADIACVSGRYKVVKTLEPNAAGDPVGTVRLYALTSNGDEQVTDDAIQDELTAKLDRWLVANVPRRRRAGRMDDTRATFGHIHHDSVTS